MYVWTDVRRRMGRAYRLVEVAELVNRHRVNIERYILDGHVRPPQKAYSLSGGKTHGWYFFSEQDIYELHDYLLTVHRGRPRKDGKITPSGIPSRAELRAMLKTGTATYVKNEDGEFVQVWKENDW